MTLVQAEVPQTLSDAVDDAVESWPRKFRPETVTDALPVAGEFGPLKDKAGESKLNDVSDVPATAPTVATRTKF